MDVALLRWPQEADRRDELAADRVPRLLVVDNGTSPPLTLDCLEDWVRADANDDDVRARVAAVERRAAAHHLDVPILDGDGVLRFGGKWVSLPPVESRLAAALVDRFGAVVGRDLLSTSGWPRGTSGRNALDVHILRLRRRLAQADLAIRTVRSRGYLLEPLRRAPFAQP
jgi:DNA-binding response OmpR family regulator